MGSGGEKRWTKGKILAVAIPVGLVVIGVVVTLALVLGGGNAGDSQAGQGEPVGEDEMVETYEEIKEQAGEAAAEMEDLGSQEAASDPDTYEQELEEALAAYEELALLVEKAANMAIEVSEDYAELYAYIYDYYDYLYTLTEQAVGDIEYLMSLLPALEDMQQMQDIVERLENLPAGGPLGELSSQLTQFAQKALVKLEETQVPEGMSVYGSEMEALARELDSLAQQMAQALQSGNNAGFASLADQMDAAITQAQQQLSSTVNSLVSGYANMLSQLEAAIQTALP